MNSRATAASRAWTALIDQKTKKAAAAALRARLTRFSLKLVADQFPAPPLQAALEVPGLEGPFDIALHFRRVPHDLFRRARELAVDALERSLRLDAQGAELAGRHAHPLPAHDLDVTLIAHLVGALQGKLHFVSRVVRVARAQRKSEQSLVRIEDARIARGHEIPFRGVRGVNLL